MLLHIADPQHPSTMLISIQLIKWLATYLPYSSIKICSSLMYSCTQNSFSSHNFINMSTLPLKHQLDFHTIYSSQMYSKVDFTKSLVNISASCFCFSIFQTWMFSGVKQDWTSDIWLHNVNLGIIWGRFIFARKSSWIVIKHIAENIELFILYYPSASKNK